MGLGGEGEEKLKEDEIRIYDTIFTFSEHALRKHPGGTIIRSKLGQNATQAFEEFHHRYRDSAEKWMKALPQRQAKYKCRGYLKAYDVLRQELVDEGYYDCNYIVAFYRIFEILLMSVIGYQLLLAGYYWIGMFILGIMSGRCGWLQHEANHCSVFCHPKWDKVLGSFLFAMGEAGSAQWWIKSHNRHHASPQHVGWDSDLNTLPALAFDRIHAAMGNPAYLKYQAWTFIPATWAVVLFWKVYLHPLQIIKKGHWMDGGFLIIHYIVWYYFFNHMGIGWMLLSHLVWGMVEGWYLFGNFSLNHTHTPIIMKHENEDWLCSAFYRTVDIKSHWFTNWWMGYLNCQVEHHLFPTMPQYRFPSLQPRIAEFAKKNNLPYQCVGYFQAVYLTAKNLDDVGHNAQHDIDLARESGARQDCAYFSAKKEDFVENCESMLGQNTKKQIKQQ